MDHGASALHSTFLNLSSNSMRLDFIDKPLSQGYWLETTDKFNFSEPEPVTFGVLNNTSEYSEFILPSHLDLNSRHQFYREEMDNFTENPPLIYPGIGLHVADIATESLEEPESFLLESSESGDRWSTDTTITMKDRLVLAVEYLKEYVEDSDVLIQIWVPTSKGGQNVLTTIDQPYSLNPNCTNLASYRNVSKTFHLTAEEDLKESAGLPGRVFLRKLPEWTPDVRFFRNDECPRKNYAKLYNVSGCLALPVFEHDSGICLAVIEIVTTTQKISYHLEVEIVCKALEAADLRSSRDFFPLGVKACYRIYQIAIPEISEILPSICETFKLPLAMTWAISDRQGEEEHKKIPEKFDHYISTVDSACCVAENDLLGFYDACSEQYLFLDQGIVGKAFATNKQWFATDITSFSKTDYPLSHHARIFNLGAAVAIPLRNMYTGLVEYVLELFLPRDCKDVEEQKQKWELLPRIIQQACQNFHVILDKELDDEVNDQVVVDFNGRLDEEGFQRFVSSPSEETCQENSSWILQDMDMAEDKCAFVTWGCQKQEPEDEFKITTHWYDNESDIYQELDVDGRDHSFVGQYSSRRAGDKRQTKTEKTITLQNLRQYFAGSLKDAAKSIGVCPTTLKRICRKHGINRWPSRKIKKVNHSLRKLQRVVDSIRGAEGLLQIESFYKTFPVLSTSKSYKTTDSSYKFNSEPENCQFRPKANDSKSQSSSCSQNSGSSFCYYTEAKQLNNSLKNESCLAIEDPVIALKRTCNEAELHSLNQEDAKILESLHGYKTLNGNVSCQILPSLTKSTGQDERDGMSFRVKATFGEKNIRFSFLQDWGFKDLQQEIGRRFKINDFTRIDFKYLDIDEELVLLTCDADLEECIDLLRLSQSNTIKITLQQASPQPLNFT